MSYLISYSQPGEMLSFASGQDDRLHATHRTKDWPFPPKFERTDLLTDQGRLHLVTNDHATIVRHYYLNRDTPSRQDSSLASWLLASISSQINKGLVGCMTAASICTKLHQNFSSSSITCIMILHDQLKVCKLLNQTMRDYLTEIEHICDNLANCGHMIEEM